MLNKFLHLYNAPTGIFSKAGYLNDQKKGSGGPLPSQSYSEARLGLLAIIRDAALSIENLLLKRRRFRRRAQHFPNVEVRWL